MRITKKYIDVALKAVVVMGWQMDLILVALSNLHNPDILNVHLPFECSIQVVTFSATSRHQSPTLTYAIAPLAQGPCVLYQ